MQCKNTLRVDKITEKNECKYTYDILYVMRLIQNQKTQ